MPIRNNSINTQSAIPNHIVESVKHAIQEDVGSGDITAALCSTKQVSAKVIARESGILCGQQWFSETFNQTDPHVAIDWLLNDGDAFTDNQIICNIQGNAPSILTAERTALNFLQTLSGTATATSNVVTTLGNSPTKILDTRKTIPGLRLAQKYAVSCGGGQNHRLGLYDAYLIKENHIVACGSIKSAIETAKKHHPDKLIEIEVETLEQLQQAIDAQADIALLDNFELDQIKQAVSLANQQIKLEVSGNVDISNIHNYAQYGVDYISSGALTKHLQAIDFSLLLD